MKLKILGIMLALLIAIQFIPYGKDHSNPTVINEPQWDSKETRSTFFTLCGDCHSHETVWTSYSKVAPISWLIQHDVNEGRDHLNVSMWNIQKRNKGTDAAQEYEEGDMPPWIYTLPRPQTILSPKDKKQFIDGLKATFENK